jgi:hypothetical protein
MNGRYNYLEIDGRLVFEHRHIVESILGRSLQDGEVVHHINGDPKDNQPENLEVFSSNGEHLHARHSSTPEERRQIAAARQAANPERHNATCRKCYHTNLERSRELARKRAQQWRLVHPGQAARNTRAWRARQRLIKQEERVD